MRYSYNYSYISLYICYSRESFWYEIVCSVIT